MAKPVSIAITLIFITLTLVGLVFGKNLLIPFAIALMIWFILNAFSSFIGRIVFNQRHLPHWLCMTLALLIMLGLLSLVIEMISSNLSDVIKTAPFYQKNIQTLFNDFTDIIGLKMLPSISQLIQQFDITSLLSHIAGSLTAVAGNAGIIFIYVIFLLLEQRSVENKLNAIFNDPDRRKKIHEILSEIQKDIEAYIALKTLLSVITGLLSFAILLGVGVDYAVFWAFLIFLLNYIPTIGSLIATIFPALLAFVQFGNFKPAFLVIFCIGLVQFVIGNILEPKIMGRSLNLSALVVLLSLALWGSLWGVVGMFLCVPITVAMMIIFSNFDKTLPVAIMLSANGNVERKKNIVPFKSK